MHKSLTVEHINKKILFLRGYKVILDSDLAQLYDVETKNLNRAVKRNQVRFPQDFSFQLTEAEVDFLRCQTVTSKKINLWTHEVGVDIYLSCLQNKALLCCRQS